MSSKVLASTKTQKSENNDLNNVENPFKIQTPLIPPTPLNFDVYEPAEDSFLLLDALESDLFKSYTKSKLNKLNFDFCIEIGPGSGIITSGLLSTPFFKSKVPLMYTIDISRSAVELTLKTADFNNCINRAECILGNGIYVNRIFRQTFDLVVCNPPYVPTPINEDLITTNERGGNLHLETPNITVGNDERNELSKSWDGGESGNEFIVPFMNNLVNVLSDSGRCYILLASWNYPEKLMENIYKIGLKSKVIVKRIAGRERLSVWKIKKIR